ncbi:hypothetical protein LXL04_024547 [Taraxacum kok-saghyz]
MVRDIPEFTIDTSICGDCMIGKQTREEIPKTSSWRAGDVRKGWVYLLSEKSQDFVSFRDFKAKVETETGKVVKALRTDRGGEPWDQKTAYHELHSATKRGGRTEELNCNKDGGDLDFSQKHAKNVLGRATCWSFYVLNRSVTKAVQDMTPTEAWCGLKPIVEHFRIWGCLAHVHIPKEKRTKLENKSVMCVLTGMSEVSKAYRLINPETMKVMISRDVVFEEYKGWNWNQNKEGAPVEKELSCGNYDFIDEYYVLIDN